MDYASLVSGLSFRLLADGSARGDDRRFEIQRANGEPAKLLELPFAPIDVRNTALPAGAGHLERGLGEVCLIPRMSTFGIGVLINQAVAAMPADEAFVNIGVWNGFTYLAGMIGNGDKKCVGVDNFSIWDAPRDAFGERFERWRSSRHHFHDMDYRDYFENVHDSSIGAYVYDGDHKYEHQFHGLEIAEPYFAEGCIVVVDDTNWRDPHGATMDFIAQSEREYTVLLDHQTTTNLHPTFWNGVLIVRAEGRKGGPGARSSAAEDGHSARPRQPIPHFSPTAVEPDPPSVSLIVHHEWPDGATPAEALESALEQTWPATEVFFADDSGGSGAAVAAEHGDRVKATIADGRRSALEAAIDNSRGDLVCFLGTHQRLPPTAVHFGLGFPNLSQFFAGVSPDRYLRLEQALRCVDEIAAVVPVGGAYAVAKRDLRMPNIDNRRHRSNFVAGDNREEPADDAEAIATLDALRSSGTRFLALTWTCFDWLERYPAFRQRLESTGRRVLENERVLLFDLDG